MKLITDSPLQHLKKEGYRNDSLSFKKYVDAIHHSVMNVDGRFTLGIYGPWGSGKTSLMRLLENKINQEKKDDAAVLTVWFDAWRFEKDDNLLFPLIGTILRSIEKERSISKDTFQKIKSGLLAVVKSLRLSANFGFDLVGTGIQASLSSDDIKDKLNDIEASLYLEQSTYFSLYESLNKISLGNGDKIIVFIDDLDRCLPDASIKLLEQIKLILDQPGFIFVIGAAKKILEDYLAYVFEKEYGLSDHKKMREAKKYLDKIIQLPINLPAPSKHKFDELIKALCQESGLPADNQELIEIIRWVSKENPRDAIRFINTIVVSSKVNVQSPLEQVTLNEGLVFHSEWASAWHIIRNRRPIIKAVLDLKNNSEASEIAIFKLLDKENNQHYKSKVKIIFEDEYFKKILLENQRSENRLRKLLEINTEDNIEAATLSNTFIEQDRKYDEPRSVRIPKNLTGAIKVYYLPGMYLKEIQQSKYYQSLEGAKIIFEEFSEVLIESEEYFLEPYSDIGEYHLWLPEEVNEEGLTTFHAQYARLFKMLQRRDDKTVKIIPNVS